MRASAAYLNVLKNLNIIFFPRFYSEGLFCLFAVKPKHVYLHKAGAVFPGVEPQPNKPRPIQFRPLRRLRALRNCTTCVHEQNHFLKIKKQGIK